MFTIWLVGGVAMFLLILAGVGWSDGKGELGSSDTDGIIMAGAVASAFWPVVIAIAVVVLPFVGLYQLFKAFGERSAKKESKQ